LRRPKLDKNKRVKAVARKQIGTPPAGRVLQTEPLRNKPKHKKTWMVSTDE
jgi:hypothetical protein